MSGEGGFVARECTVRQPGPLWAYGLVVNLYCILYMHMGALEHVLV